jgi:amino acid transporter
MISMLYFLISLADRSHFEFVLSFFVKIGEIVTLPIVVLVTIMAQPRLQFAMARDGLLPPIFAHIDESGNLWYGTVMSGALCVMVATCVPFIYLNDLISAGILLAFSMTDASVILLRQSSPERRPFLLQKLLFAFNFLSLTVGLTSQGGNESLSWRIVSGLHIFALFTIAVVIGKYCPRIINVDEDDDYFETPLVPYLPLLGQFLNCYLIGQLEVQGLLLLLGYTVLSIVFYFAYGAKHSFGNKTGWKEFEEKDSSISTSTGGYQEIPMADDSKDLSSMTTSIMPLDQHGCDDNDLSVDSEDRYDDDDDDGISMGTEDLLIM